MKRKRILVVDDEVSFTRLLKLNLEQTGEYEVHAENQAEAVVGAALRFRPDLILLDVMMPRMVGSDVAARLQAHAHLKATPIVFLSAAARGNWASEPGATARSLPFIAKPASVEDVLDGIEQELNKGPLTLQEEPPDAPFLPAFDDGLSPESGGFTPQVL